MPAVTLEGDKISGWMIHIYLVLVSLSEIIGFLRRPLYLYGYKHHPYFVIPWMDRHIGVLRSGSHASAVALWIQ